jgi:cell division protein FtsQ
VAGASATTTEDLSLRLTGGPTVLWGGSDGAAHKAQVLAALLDQLGRGALGPAGTVDVSAPDAVVLR